MNDVEEIIQKANKYRWEIGENLHDAILESIYTDAARIADKTVTRQGGKQKFDWDRWIDKLVTGRWTGFPIMFLLLVIVFWLTISGANVPSAMIASLLVDTIHPLLKDGANFLHFPWWLSGVLIDGAY